MSKPVLILLASATLLALPATAATPSSYAEVAAGLSRGDIDCAGTRECDRSSSFARLTVGHEFAPGLAAELFVGQWGRLTAAADMPGLGTVRAEVRVRGVGLGLAATLPLASDWTLDARLGLASNQAQVKGSVAGGAASTRSERHTAPYAGVGIRWRLDDMLWLGLHVDSTRIQAEGEKATLTLAGVSLRMAF